MLAETFEPMLTLAICPDSPQKQGFHVSICLEACKRYGASTVIPPKKPKTPNTRPPGEKWCRQANHNPESARRLIKTWPPGPPS